MSKAPGHWLISTQVSKTGSDLDGVLPSTKTDAACLLDPAYAGTNGADVFRKSRLNAKGFWGVVLYKDRFLGPTSDARAAAVVSYYKPWLPPWQRS